MLTDDDLLELGFKPKYRIVSAFSKYELSRDRWLYLVSAGAGNECLFICSKGIDQELPDLVCIHNRDYDGFLTKERLKSLIYWLEKK